MERPDRYFDDNVVRSAALLEAVYGAAVPGIVFSSSCSVYGSPHALPVAEDHPTAPETPYGLGHIPSLRVFGTDYPTPDGTAIRDYVHVVDLADAHVRALEHLRDGGTSTVINLGTGRGSSVLNVVAVAKQASGVDFPVELVDRRPGDPPAVYADNARAASLLGWRPVYALEETVASAWRWASTDPDGYATVAEGMPWPASS
jgi:UDP-glucose 4-epimerase